MVVAHAQGVATVASPLIVALLCLYARHRRIGDTELLLWACSHLALALAFLLVQAAPSRGDLDDLPIIWRLTQFCNTVFAWLLLAGVLALEDSRITARRGLLGGMAISLAITAISAFDPRLYLYAGVLFNPLVTFIAGAILLYRLRSVVHILASLVIMLRTGNGLLYALAVQDAGSLLLPSYTTSFSIFLNLLTGISLLAIVIENAWRRLGAALEEARFSAAVMDLAPVSILHKDRDLRILRANRYFTKHVGRFDHGQETVLGRPSSQLMPADAANAIEQIDRQLLAAPETGPIEHEVTMLSAEGLPITLLVRKAAVTDEAGNTTGIISASLDISHLKSVEAELRKQIAMVEQASKAKSDFLANMSHELRTPLNGIGGFAEMLAAGYMGPLNPRQKEYVDSIILSNRRMQSLVSDILDLSRLDAGNMVLTRETLDLGELIDMIVSTVAPAAAAQAITLNWQPVALEASVDRVALLQVLLNLIDNAIRFNRPHGMVSIALARTDDGNRVRIIVTDTGPGITEAQVAASQDPFLRSDPLKARQGGGAGLGLAICRGLIELHGGRLQIEGRPDQGTVVTVLL